MQGIHAIQFTVLRKIALWKLDSWAIEYGDIN